MLNRLPLALILSLLVCLLVFVSAAFALLFAVPSTVVLSGVFTSWTDRVLMLLPILGLSLLMLAACFSFARILFRGSPVAAKRFLMLVIALSVIAACFNLDAPLVWIVGYLAWTASLVLLFFSIQPKAA